MSKMILFNSIENPVAKKAAREFEDQGDRVYLVNEQALSQIGDRLDLLILSVPEPVRDPVDVTAGHPYEELLETVSQTVSGILQLTKECIPLLRNGDEKRIAFITDRHASIRENEDETDYAYHMYMAALHMMMRILFNTYRPEGFTFRCYAADADIEGISAAQYIQMNQSYIAADDYIHSDENRIVIRDALLREISW